MRRFSKHVLLAVAVVWYLPAASWAGPPPQKLPSALLMFPFIEVGGADDSDTRIEIVNLSGDPQVLQCFYVDDFCNEIGFFVFLTPYQPVAWSANSGTNDESAGTAAPPFYGSGELKCAVVPPRPEVQFHNAIQGRATVFGADGQTVSYGAVGFQRLTDGDFTGVLTLDGKTYAQCPDRLHFDVLTDQPTVTSDMILVPCTQDLLLQTPTSIQVLFTITNEFESTFSAATNITCAQRFRLGSIANTLSRATAGTDTAHVVVRGVTGPVIGLVIDGVSFAGLTGTAGNEPSFQGGRSATVIFP